MTTNWIWPKLSDTASARKAVQGGVAACGFIAAASTAIGCYALLSGRNFAGYNAGTLFDAAIFAIIAWQLWRNSRTWSVIGLLLFGLEIYDKLRHHARTFNVITIILLVMIANAVRGTFAFHKYKDRTSARQEPPTQI